MPALVERRKATQKRAITKQRKRIQRLHRLQRQIKGVRARIAKARHNMSRRQTLIEGAGKARVKLAPSRVTGRDSVQGGSPRERLVAAALVAAQRSASGARQSFYSQVGYWDVHHGVTGESSKARSDCSQWVTAIYNAAGLPDPNGADYQGGYTGTLGSHGKATAHPKPGDLGLYGGYPYHHVEMYVGNGHFVGHGSPPVDGVTPGWPSVFRNYLGD